MKKKKEFTVHYNIGCDFHWNGFCSSIISTATNPPKIRIVHSIFRFYFGRLTNLKGKAAKAEVFFSFPLSPFSQRSQTG